MADQSPSPSSIPPMVVVGLIIATIGAFTFNQRPFQDARPSETRSLVYSHTPAEAQDVEARLWEDPLGAVALARDTDKKEAQVTRQECFQELSAKLDDGGLLAGCQKYLAAISQSHAPQSLKVSLSTRSVEGDSFMVMGALVSGAPYADDVETRRRTRYAILSGLYRTGFVPVNHEHIGYLTLAVPRPGETAGAHDIVAYELFESETDSLAAKQYVLVLWLDQDGFRDSPIKSFSELVKTITPDRDRDKVHVAIVGPADSDGLRSMASELAANFVDEMGKGSPNSWKVGNPCAARAANATPQKKLVEIYSPRATADDADLIQAAVGVNGASATTTLAQDFNCWSRDVRLFRTVASDKATADRLWAELKYRGVHDYRDLALITERDGLYARLIGKYFGGCTNPPGSNPSSDPSTDSKPHPLCMTYLRGLDGLAPPSAESGAKPKSRSQEGAPSSQQPDAAPIASEAASGSGQLDYLRRTAGLLSTMQGVSDCDASKNEKGICKKRNIKAIGIIGGDIYDKLLALQALRDTFPRATFFTFDMDARLFEAQNLQWTRQILIGSSLGLALRRELQGDVPPFRDTYQATTFFSALLAVHRAFGTRSPKEADIRDEPGLGWTHYPRIYEMGRSRPFDITNDTKIGSACILDEHCDSLSASQATRAFVDSLASSEVAMALIVACFTFSLFWISMGRKRMMGAYQISDCKLLSKKIVVHGLVAIGCALLLVSMWNSLITAITHDNSSIPPPIFSGASPWAANLFELLSVIAVVVLVARGQRKLGENAEKMRREFGLSMSCEDMVTWRTKQLATWAWRQRIVEFFWFPFSRLTDKKSDTLPSNGSELEALLAVYLHRGTLIARSVRVFIVTLFTTLILYKLESIPTLPLGGGVPQFDAASFDQWFGSSISLISLFAMQFLVLWVADAILLSRSFLLALQHTKPSWPAAALTLEKNKVMLPDLEATFWLNLQLIARRTRWVSNLIWYPSCVIAAMFIAAITVQFGRFRFADNPIALAICTLVIVVAVWQIRRTAESWRDEVVDDLEDMRLLVLHTRENLTPPDNLTGQLDRLLDRVSDLKDGAFAPISAQPIVRAVLLPLLTYGATILLQYYHVS